MTPEWYEDLAERLGDAHDEALFSGDPMSAEAFTKATTAAGERARRLRNEYRAEQLHPAGAVTEPERYPAHAMVPMRPPRDASEVFDDANALGDLGAHLYG